MAEHADASAMLRITVVVCVAPRETKEWTLELPAGATVADALRHCAHAHMPVGSAGPSSVGIWGREVGPEASLQNLDRVEVYRPLTVDPKVARRERFARQGARSTGLFARQRPGGKPGY